MATTMIKTSLMQQIESGLYKAVGTIIVPTEDEK